MNGQIISFPKMGTVIFPRNKTNAVNTARLTGTSDFIPSSSGDPQLFENSINQAVCTLKGDLEYHLAIEPPRTPVMIPIVSNSPSFICNICQKKFSQLHLLKSHYLIHNKTKPYTCKLCKRGFYNRNNIITHLRSHNEGEFLDFEARQYDAQYETASCKKSHHQSQHPVFYVCDICRRKFPNERSLKLHMNFHTDQQREIISWNFQQERKKFIRIPAKEKKILCGQCITKLSCKNNLDSCGLYSDTKIDSGCSIIKKEVDRKNIPVYELNDDIKSVPEKEATASVMIKKVPLACDMCHMKVFVNRYYFPENPKEDSDGKVEKKRFKIFPRNLVARNVESAMFCCEVCAKSGFTRSLLKKHLYMHSTETSTQCSICSRTFWNKEDAVKHCLIHKDERPFFCDVCHMRFFKKPSWDKHLKSHHIKEFFRISENLKNPLLCEICGKGFPCESTLLEHLRIHTGEKPYVCDFCQMVFTFKQELNCHLLTHKNAKIGIAKREDYKDANNLLYMGTGVENNSMPSTLIYVTCSL